eukprot:1206467-Amphidinium_carterae.1
MHPEWHDQTLCAPGPDPGFRPRQASYSRSISRNGKKASGSASQMRGLVMCCVYLKEQIVYSGFGLETLTVI